MLFCPVSGFWNTTVWVSRARFFKRRSFVGCACALLQTPFVRWFAAQRTAHFQSRANLRAGKVFILAVKRREREKWKYLFVLSRNRQKARRVVVPTTMSFYFRDSPRFADRLRGMPDDELLREVKQRFNEDNEDAFLESGRRTRGDSFDRPFPHFPRVSRKLIS